MLWSVVLLICLVPPATGQITAFKNVNLVPMTSNRVVPGQSVIVFDGKIQELGPSNETSIPAGATVIDGTGRYLMPGLADMHTHLNDAMFDYPFFNLFLANGVTTIRDLAQGSPPSVLYYRREIEASKRLGPNILVAYTLWGWEKDITGLIAAQRPLGYDCLKVNSYFTPAGFDTTMHETKRLGWYTLGHIPELVRFDGVVAGGMTELSHIEEFMIFELLDMDWSKITDSDSFDDQLMQAIQKIADKYLNASEEEIRAAYSGRIRKAVSKLKGTDMTLTTTVVIHEDIMHKLMDIEKIKAAPYAKYVSPRFWEDIAAGKDKHMNMVPKGEERLWFAIYEIQNMLLQELKRNDVKLVLGTDVGPTYMSLVPGFSTHDELRMLTENGFSPYEALVTATREAGAVAGRMTGANDFGTIETGKRADLLLLAANPLEKIENARNPLGVMVRGYWLPRDTLQTLLAIKTTKITDLLSAAYSQGGIDAAIERYDHIVDNNFDNRYYYSSATLNRIGYDLLAADRVDDALRVFELNTKEYPEDWNVFDSCAEALMKAGKTDLAIRNYERARAIDPSQSNPLKKLRELRGEKN